MELEIRKADIQDMDLIYEWANDPVVRRNGFHTDPIPYENHVKWYQRLMEDEASCIYIVSQMQQNIGQVRFHIEDDFATIGYSVCEKMRGKGFAPMMLHRAEQELAKDIPSLKGFYAQVKYDNIPSKKVFQKLNYHMNEVEQYIEFVKELS